MRYSAQGNESALFWAIGAWLCGERVSAIAAG